MHHAPEATTVVSKLSREKVNHLSHVIARSLSEDDLIEFHDDANEIRLVVLRVIQSELKRDSDIDHVVRKKIEGHRRPILDGSREYDILYKKYFEEEISRFRRFSE